MYFNNKINNNDEYRAQRVVLWIALVSVPFLLMLQVFLTMYYVNN